ERHLYRVGQLGRIWQELDCSNPSCAILHEFQVNARMGRRMLYDLLKSPGDIFGIGERQMWLISASVISTHPFSELASGEQSVWLNHCSFPMHSFGLNGIEPRALFRQEKGQDTHTFACLLHVPIMLTNPVPNQFTDVHRYNSLSRQQGYQPAPLSTSLHPS